MIGVRAAIVELVRAALLLALLALPFVSHAAPALARGLDGHWVGTATQPLCGGGLAGDGDSHAPCHACRLFAGLDLPPPSAIVLRIPRLVPVCFGVLPASTIAHLERTRPQGRAPPDLV